MKACSMGMDCDDAGVCYAEAMGDASRCPSRIPGVYQFAGAVSRGLGPDILCWVDQVDPDTRWAFDGVQVWRQKGGQHLQFHRTDRVPFHPQRMTQMAEMVKLHSAGVRTMIRSVFR